MDSSSPFESSSKTSEEEPALSTCSDSDSRVGEEAGDGAIGAPGALSPIDVGIDAGIGSAIGSAIGAPAVFAIFAPP
jgi:hypothetical protein